MRTIEVEIFSETTNSPVIKMPNRKFPGVVIQGDSLWILTNWFNSYTNNFQAKIGTNWKLQHPQSELLLKNI